MENSTEEEIESLLETVCTLMGPLEGECDAFIVENIPVWIKYILQFEPVRFYCSLLGLCGNTDSHTQPVPVLSEGVKKGFLTNLHLTTADWQTIRHKLQKS